MIGQGGGPGVPRRPSVLVEEVGGQVGTPQALEVHGEERHVGQHVTEAEPVVELEAVEHPGAVVETEDVIGQEVAVAVAGSPLGDPPLEQRLASGEEAPSENQYPASDLRSERLA